VTTVVLSNLDAVVGSDYIAFSIGDLSGLLSLECCELGGKVSVEVEGIQREGSTRDSAVGYGGVDPVLLKGEKRSEGTRCSRAWDPR